MNNKKERILVLYLTTGGGHIAAARALADDCSRRYPSDDVEVHTLDGTPPNASFLRKTLEDGYRFASLTIPFLWSMLYYLSTLPFIMGIYLHIMALISAPHIRKYVREHNITRIVYLHSLLNTAVIRALQQLHRVDMPVFTVITDPFTCHPIWFLKQSTPLVLSSKRLYSYARRHLRWIGTPTFLLPREREIVIIPPILHSKFDRPINAEACAQLRDTYGFSRNKRLLLIAGGGEGLPNGELCLKALARENLDIEIAFVCGHNTAQYANVSKIIKQYPDVPIKVYGFIDFMYDLMNMADVILTKAGPATVLEALILKKPLIITQKLYGQERGNVDFVVNNELGWFITNPAKMVQKVREIIEAPETFARVVKNITQTEIRSGTSQILDYVLSLPLKPEHQNRLLAFFHS